MKETFNHTIFTPVGYLNLVSDENNLISVSFTDIELPCSEKLPDILIETTKQLQEYFEGKRKIFNLSIQPAGTDFQINVWERVMNVEFGETATYLDIAMKTGSKNNTRAVGLANGKNPIPIIIPCHRIIGVNGKLTGYAGGIEKKRWLLQHEQKHSKKSTLLF